VSPYTGEKVNAMGMSGSGYLGPVIAENTIYLLTDNAELSAYR